MEMLTFRSMNMASERQVMFDDGFIHFVDSIDEVWRPWLNSVLDMAKCLKLILDQDLTGFCCLSALALLKHGK